MPPLHEEMGEILVMKICVVGAGTMGNGIAQVCAQSGYQTALVDITSEICQQAMDNIKRSLDRFVKKGSLKPEDAERILSRIHLCTDLKQGAGDADIVIEAVFERAEVKLALFKQLEDICPQHVIFASNTSGIPISLLASATKRPDKVIGMHFMNPVPLMKGIEVIRSLLTSDNTLQQILATGKSMGKETVIVKDSPGFVTNRLYCVVCNEAAKLVQENIASVEEIDRIMLLSFNWPMGPLELADLIGVDVIVDLMDGIYKETGWERYKPAPILRRMVEIDYRGRKAGKGFYQLAK
jgi:3-hydroxybutyryl-CoA dehydrogenase